MHRFFALLLALFVSHSALAAPDKTPDEMAQFLAERGLLQRIGDAGLQLEARASELVVKAMGFLGVPYKRGGSSVETGVDCSGFVRAIYEQTAGLILPRNAAQQAAATEKINRNDLQPGDLVFFNTM